MPEVDCQGRGTDNATVVKLNLIRLIGCSNLTVPLHISDFINERGMSPGLNRSLGLRGGDDVSSCLFDYAEPVEFELADDRCLPSARRASSGYSFSAQEGHKPCVKIASECLEM